MKKDKRTAVFSVVFPNAEPFLEKFLGSLEQQTRKDFDVVVINDNVPSFGETAVRYDLNIQEIPLSKGMAKNREYGINHIRDNGYDYIVFADSDDMSAPDRVAKSIELLGRHDIVVNDFTTVNADGNIIKSHYMAERLKDGSAIYLEDMLDKNICGFSNAALRVDCLPKSVRFDRHLIAVDWYLFTLLLKKGRNAVFTAKTTSFYRLYGGNIAGVSPKMNKKKVESDISIKLAHYKALAKVDNTFSRLYSRSRELDSRMRNDVYNRNYIAKLRSADTAYPLWWEHIKFPEEIGL